MKIKNLLICTLQTANITPNYKKTIITIPINKTFTDPLVLIINYLRT